MAGYVEKRGEGHYRLAVITGYKSDGKKKRKYKTIAAKNKTEAKKELAKFVTEIEAGEYIAPEKMRFASFVEEWGKKYGEKHLAETTLQNYRLTINKRLLPAFGDKKLSDIQPIHIVNYLDELREPGQRVDGKEKPLSEASIQFNHRILKNIFSRAVEWQVIKNNPVSNIKNPKVIQGSSSAYDNDEVNQLKNALEYEPLHWKTMILLVLSTGMRRGEVLGLEWDHIDLETGTIDIKQTIGNVRGKDYSVKEPKTGKSRMVALPDPLVNLLKSYKEQCTQERLEVKELWEGGKHFFVFSSWHGKPMYPSSITQWWRRFLKRHELRHIRFHDLRHTSATFLLNEGVHAKIISERLGHADIKTTMNIYSHVLRSADHEAAKHFTGLFSDESKEDSKKA